MYRYLVLKNNTIVAVKIEESSAIQDSKQEHTFIPNGMIQIAGSDKFIVATNIVFAPCDIVVSYE